MTDTPFVLGWNRPKRTERLLPRLYPAPRAPQLRSVMHELYGPVLNQGQIGSCTGNDVTDCLRSVPLYDAAAAAYDEQTALGVYSLAEKILGGQGYPPEDNGATNGAAAAAAVRLGLASGWTHCLDFEHFLSTLVLQPVMFASEWTAEMFDPAPGGEVRPIGAVQGGHSYAAIGLDVASRRVWFLNSWGSSWGVNGTFWMSFLNVGRLFEQNEVIALHVAPTPHRQRTPRGCLAL